MGATGRLYSFAIHSLCDLPDHKLPHSLLEIQATEARIDFSSIFIEILAPLFGGLCWFIQQRIRQCLSFSPWLIKIMGWFISLITVLVMCDWLLVLYKLLIQNYL